jgi:hypothetical protein
MTRHRTCLPKRDIADERLCHRGQSSTLGLTTSPTVLSASMRWSCWSSVAFPRSPAARRTRSEGNWSSESGTTGKAGGLPFAGPSKGPGRKRRNTTTERSHSFRGRDERTGIITNCIIPELSNSTSPPAKPGVYLEAIILTFWSAIVPLIFKAPVLSPILGAAGAAFASYASGRYKRFIYPVIGAIAAVDT